MRVSVLVCDGPSENDVHRNWIITFFFPSVSFPIFRKQSLLYIKLLLYYCVILVTVCLCAHEKSPPAWLWNWKNKFHEWALINLRGQEYNHLIYQHLIMQIIRDYTPLFLILGGFLPNFMQEIIKIWATVTQNERKIYVQKKNSET